MKKTEKIEKDIEVFRFDNNIPTPYEPVVTSNTIFQPYGIDNMYPFFLLKLYNESPIHSSIINSKANFIVGNGLKYSTGQDITAPANPAESFHEFINKVVKDYLIFNYFCVEVIYNKLNQPIEYHFIPGHKVRTNKDKTRFWYWDNFVQMGNTYQFSGKKPIIFDRYKPYSKDTTSKIFFFDGYSPSIFNVYPLPEYNGALTAILTDIEIRNFNLNNIKNHFSVSSLITFFKGQNVADEIKKKVISDLKASYTGSHGGKLIVDFQDTSGQAATVQNISPNDWDKAYSLLSQSVKDDIFIAHSVTSPSLFGVKTQGQLGGTTEQETSYEIFKDNIIRNKRNELQAALNYLFTDSEIIKGKVEFDDRQLFSARISELLKEKIFTINELRKEAGAPPIAGGDKVIGEVEKVPNMPFSNQKKESVCLSEEDFDKIKDMGVTVEEFDFISDEEEMAFSKADIETIQLNFETNQEIGDYLIKNNLSGKTLKELKAALRKDLGINITLDKLSNVLNTLNKAGVIDVKVKGDTIEVHKPKDPTPDKKVELMYNYQARPGLGDDIIETTRPFCKKLIENSKYYSREDIQTMSSIFGYDVFNYGGGFYRNSDTDEVTPYCRHYFKAKTVIRKTK